MIVYRGMRGLAPMSDQCQILQLLLNTYIHHCVKNRSTRNDISDCERHCHQNLHVATEGKNFKYSYE